MPLTYVPDKFNPGIVVIFVIDNIATLSKSAITFRLNAPVVIHVHCRVLPSSRIFGCNQHLDARIAICFDATEL